MRYLLLLWFVGSISCFAQQIVSNQHTRCHNPVPEAFRTSPREKVIDSIEDLNTKERRFDRKNRERFIMESHFYGDMMCKSGYVCFNDSVTQYIEDVAKQLLRDKPEIFNQLHFYTLRSTEVNSFCSAEGTVYVTQGLLAQLENEAQLAAVLSHEIVHFIKKHGIESFVKYEQIEAGKGSYRRINSDNKKLLQTSYSRENETEADSVGYAMFYKSSNYKQSEIARLFTILLYGDLPIDEIPFSKSIFETPLYKQSDSFLLKSVQGITAVEDYSDSLSTHPNIKKRRELMIRLTANDTRGEKFLLGKERFEAIKRINQYDLSTLFILERDYASSIYNSFVLLQKDPDNQVLKEKIATALYYIYKYNFYSARNEVLTDWEKIEGESQQLFYFLYHIENFDLMQLAFHQLWKASTLKPQDQLLKQMLHSVAIDFFYNNSFTLDEVYEATRYRLASTETQSIDTVDQKELSKYEKIERKRKTEAPRSTRLMSIADLALNGEVGTDEKLRAYFAEAKKYADSLQAVATAQSSSKYYRQKRKEERKGKSLHIDNLIVFDPFYYKIDTRRKSSVRYLDAEEPRQNLVERCKLFSTKLHLNTQVFDYNSLLDGDAEKFNDYSVFRLWNEQQDQIEERSIVNYLQYDMALVAEKYGVEHVAWLGAVAYRQKREQVGWTLLKSVAYSFYFPPAFLWGIYYAVTPNELCYYSVEVFNCKTGKQELNSKVVFRQHESNDIRNSIMYDALNQVKRNK